MPESVSFKVATYRKLAKDEHGFTQMSSVRIAASQVIDWVLAELPEDAVTISHDETGEISTTVIDWGKVPEAIRHPKLPARRR